MDERSCAVDGCIEEATHSVVVTVAFNSPLLPGGKRLVGVITTPMTAYVCAAHKGMFQSNYKSLSFIPANEGH